MGSAGQLGNSEVLELLKAGISPDVIIAKIKASSCHFDTSAAALKQLKADGVPDSVMLAMVEAPSTGVEPSPGPIPATQPTSSTAAASKSVLSPEIAAERTRRDLGCPGCKFLLVASVDAKTGHVTDDWYSKNQLDLVKHHIEEVKTGKRVAKFVFTKHRENADYILFWTVAQGFRPYVTYVPHTETSTANVSGNYNSYGASGADYGNFNGTVTVNRTYYQAQNGQWPYIDAVLTVYDRSGKKIYETWHQGNFRWSKPDKDCLEDAFKYLRALEP